MKITLRFPKGEVATFERGEWACADETLLACCKMPPRDRSAETDARKFLRSVRLFAGRIGAQLTIESATTQRIVTAEDAAALSAQLRVSADTALALLASHGEPDRNGFVAASCGGKRHRWKASENATSRHTLKNPQ